jgi:ABC-type dipeptide/oligopeptide/nickel transport system permease component
MRIPSSRQNPLATPAYAVLAALATFVVTFLGTLKLGGIVSHTLDSVVAWLGTAILVAVACAFVSFLAVWNRLNRH